MIPHHEQAVTISALAQGRAEHPQVRALAARVADVQRAEVLVYERWLEGHGMAPSGAPLDEAGAEDHPQMPGMATEADLTELRALTGTAFDRRWLELMIAHHEGALQMVDTWMTHGGTSIRVGEIAADVSVGQSDEITVMRDLLAGT